MLARAPWLAAGTQLCLRLLAPCYSKESGRPIWPGQSAHAGSRGEAEQTSLGQEAEALKGLGPHLLGAGSPGGVGPTSLPGPPARGPKPHFDISVGDVTAVQELDGRADITHDLCGFCRHRGGGSDATQRSDGLACPPCSPRDSARWRQHSCSPGPPFHTPAPGTLLSSEDALAHLDLFPRAWATSP